MGKTSRTIVLDPATGQYEDKLLLCPLYVRTSMESFVPAAKPCTKKAKSGSTPRTSYRAKRSLPNPPSKPPAMTKSRSPTKPRIPRVRPSRLHHQERTPAQPSLSQNDAKIAKRSPPQTHRAKDVSRRDRRLPHELCGLCSGRDEALVEEATMIRGAGLSVWLGT